MKLLLDTHTFLWMDGDPARLSVRVAAAIRSRGNDVLLSVISIWEIAIKVQLGKLTLPARLPVIVAQQQGNGLQVLPVSLDHVLEVMALPALHKDPFDRLLIAQARVERVELVTVDPVIAQYPVQIFW